MGVQTDVQRRRRQTSHGIECEECGSCNVVIKHTRTRVVPCERGEIRAVIRKQDCECRKCGYMWWRRFRIGERELDA